MRAPSPNYLSAVYCVAAAGPGRAGALALRRIYETIGGNGGGVVKVGRNDPCPCGSGRKYKNCCEGKTAAKDALYSKGLPILLGAVLVSVVVLIGAAFYSSAPTDFAVIPASQPRGRRPV